MTINKNPKRERAGSYELLAFSKLRLFALQRLRPCGATINLK
jgi:hypothetical protein